jgi:hypothetical protein
VGLCLFAALGLAAISAAGAQAEPNAHVYVNTVLLNTTIGVKVESEKHTLLLSTVGKTNTPIEILCTKASVDDGLINSGVVTGNLLFAECSTFLNKDPKASEPCKPKEPIEANVKGLLFLHNGHNYLLVSPASGTVFTTLNLGEECSVGEKFEVEGNAVIEDCNSLHDLGVEQEVHLIQQASSALFPSHGLKFGKHVANIHGSANVTLTGVHAGLPWKALV